MGILMAAMKGFRPKPLEGKPSYTLPDLSKNVPLSKACSKCNKNEKLKAAPPNLYRGVK